MSDTIRPEIRQAVQKIAKTASICRLCGAPKDHDRIVQELRQCLEDARKRTKRAPATWFDRVDAILAKTGEKK